jgi:hypothetical protein
VNDDWRIRVTLLDEGSVHGLIDELRDARVASRARDKLGGAVAVSREGADLHLYAGSQDDARRAEEVLREVLGDRARQASFEHARWHEVEERWEPWDAPLPGSPEALAAERERRDLDERDETEDVGEPLWQVRAELHSRKEAAALQQQLDAEGVPSVRRHRYVLVGAASEGDAEALRDRIAAIVSPQAYLTVEGTEVAAEIDRPYSKIAAILGGLGG